MTCVLPFQVWVEVPAVAPTSAEDFNGHADNDDTGDSGGRTTVAPQTPAIPTASAAGEIANADGVYEALLREYDGPEEPATTKEEPPKDTWHWFYEFRRACNSHRRVFLVLELTADLPDSETEIARWKGEPLSAIKFDTHTFLSNRGGFPVLSRAHQAVAKEFFLLNVQCVVDGPTLHVRRPPKPRGNEPPEPPDPMCLYYAYLNNLWRVRYFVYISAFRGLIVRVVLVKGPYVLVCVLQISQRPHVRRTIHALLKRSNGRQATKIICSCRCSR